MKALILAAGYGTRLYPLVQNTAKALLKVKNKPLVDHILDRIKDLDGLNEVIVVTNNKFNNDFKTWAETHSDIGFNIEIVNDKTETPDDRLGSIGDINFVLDNVNVDDDLLIVGGDNLFNFNLDDYVDLTKQKPNSVTIGLYDIENLQDAKKFGVVVIDDSRKITSFEEKPQNPKSSLIAMCFYYLPKNTLNLVSDYLREIDKSDTAGDYIRWLCKNNEVYGFNFTGKWYDIGSIEAYQTAEKNF
ncbi:MAG: nucleotidyltransferase family protein [Candidatus Zapsychrus exili]|nr:nucleotidyltransferase family protein [Candidatus Zapsychrus exili]